MHWRTENIGQWLYVCIPVFLTLKNIKDASLQLLEAYSARLDRLIADERQWWSAS